MALNNNLGEWEALAEIYLDGQPVQGQTTSPTYCLCSRVFIKNYYDVYASTLEKDEEVSETEEVVEATEQSQPFESCPPPTDTHVHFSVVSAAELLIETSTEGIEVGDNKKPQDHDADNDANSCYYSASASHTDNYCSTDEHEHHVVTGSSSGRQQVFNNKNKKSSATGITATKTKVICERLHSSDSGADISENHLLDKMRWPADHHHGTLMEGSAEDDEEATAQNDKSKEAMSMIKERGMSCNRLLSPNHHQQQPPPHALVHHERNNSLPNILCPEELANEWETYWGRHGEQLIWSSWIEKYSDYIDPTFKEAAGMPITMSTSVTGDSETVNLQNNKTPTVANNKNGTASFDHCSTANTMNEKNIFTFDEEEIEGLEEEKGVNLVLPTEIVVESCSPGRIVPHEEVAACCWHSYRANRLSVDERLLSPRCDSVNSSIRRGGGAAATDSMTNVTRMTISSCEFCSSKVTSESSRAGNEDGEESMTNSSMTRSSSGSDEGENLVTHSSHFYDAIDGHQRAKVDPRGVKRGGGGGDEEVKEVVPEAEDAMDVDQYWQVLWEKHFQEQYAWHYKEFTAEQQQQLEERLSTLSGSLKSETIFDKCVSDEQQPSTKAQQRRSRSVKRLRKSANECLPKLVANLKIKACGAGDQPAAVDHDGEEKKEAAPAAQEDQADLMASLGLPQQFGSSRPTRSGRNNSSLNPDDDEDKDRPPRQRQATLKRSHESDTEEANRGGDSRIKDAFQLMGFAFETAPPPAPAEKEAAEDGGDDEVKPQPVAMVVSGEVVYRKKHIRLHNRALKMKIQTRPKLHIRFDEDGNAMEDSSTDAAEGQVDAMEEGGGSAPAADPVLLHSSSDDDSGGGGGGAHHQRTGAMAASQAAAAAVGWLSNQQTSGEAVGSDAEEQQLPEVQQQKKKKRKRKGKITALLPPEIANDKTLMKYWYKRFSLFQMFDAGIKMDRESWFSVTPEKVAAHAAERCRCDLIVDGFCGVGGNAIQFAMTCVKVIAIDIDPKKIEMAKHNAGIYGVADRIEFIVGDFFQLADSLKADAVFLSPPWGGPQYMKVDTYDLEEHLEPSPASFMMQKARQISENVAIFIPRNSNTQQLTQLAGPGGKVEIEQSFLDRKLIALTAYYGELINE